MDDELDLLRRIRRTLADMRVAAERACNLLDEYFKIQESKKPFTSTSRSPIIPLDPNTNVLRKGSNLTRAPEFGSIRLVSNHDGSLTLQIDAGTPIPLPPYLAIFLLHLVNQPEEGGFPKWVPRSDFVTGNPRYPNKLVRDLRKILEGQIGKERAKLLLQTHDRLGIRFGAKTTVITVL